MPRRWLPQLDFSSGELDPRLEGRRDLERYASACRLARNLLIGKGGSVSRRPGLANVLSQAGKVQLIDWQREDGDYLVVPCLDGNLRLYDEAESLVATLAASATSGSIGNTDWANDAAEMLLFHGGHAPRRLRKISGTWSLPDYPFTYYPYYAYQFGLTLTPSATTGAITLTTSGGHWVASHVGSSVRYQGKRINITGFTSTTVVSGTVVDSPLAGTAATTNWDEQAWSTVRGWPRAACWHQGRLVIASTSDLPDWVWFSKSGNGRSFDLAGAADSDAIWTRIQADEGVTIRFLRSQGPLLILADGTEWIVPQQPITPTSISVDRQASQGVARVKPGEIDAATIYLRSARDGNDGDSDQPVVHLAWDELQQTFRPLDIALLSQHLIDAPVDIAVSRGSQIDANNRIWLANTSGTVAVLHLPSPERPGGTLIESQLSIYTLAAVNGRVYAAANMGGTHRIFRFDSGRYLDASDLFDKGSGVFSTTVGTYTRFASLSVQVLGLTAAGWTVQTVTANGSGLVTVPVAVNKGEVGLAFTMRLQTLPLEAAPQTIGSLKSIVEIRAQVIATLGLRMGDPTDREPARADDGSALGDITTTAAPTGFTGTARSHGYGGWSDLAIVELRSGEPWPFTMTSLNTLVEF